MIRRLVLLACSTVGLIWFILGGHSGHLEDEVGGGVVLLVSVIAIGVDQIIEEIRRGRS